jgi:hypothetical protein
MIGRPPAPATVLKGGAADKPWAGFGLRRVLIGWPSDVRRWI